MNFQKEIAGVTISSYDFDPSILSGATLTIDTQLIVNYETLLSIANISTHQWYYITPGDSSDVITDITNNVITMDLSPFSGITTTSGDSFQIIVASKSETNPTNLISQVNLSANTYFYEILNDHIYHTLQIIATDDANVNSKIYTTIDSDATIPTIGGTVSPTSSWKDITSDMFLGQTTSGSNINLLAIVDTATRVPRYLLETTFSGATNTLDVYYTGITI